MFAIGVILFVIGVGGGVLLGLLVAQSTQSVEISAAGVSVGLLPVTLVVAGAAAVVLAWLGTRLAGAGFRRRRAQRHELRRSREEVQRLRSTQRETPSGTKTGSTAPTGPVDGRTRP